jgi:alanine racemase
MRVAVVGAGYADGVPVAASNRGTAVLHDEQVNIVGRVSMDLTMVDATDANLPVEVGGVVAFRGKQLEIEAKAAQSSNYELLVRMGQRCRRDYWKARKKEELGSPERRG